jgi:hypothetical protein
MRLSRALHARVLVRKRQCDRVLRIWLASPGPDFLVSIQRRPGLAVPLSWPVRVPPAQCLPGGGKNGASAEPFPTLYRI